MIKSICCCLVFLPMLLSAKEALSPKEYTAERLLIKMITPDGKYITLNRDIQYRVCELDRDMVKGWSVGTEVSVVETGDAESSECLGYPSFITNLSSKKAVRVIRDTMPTEG